MGLRPETERWIAVVVFGAVAAAQVPVLGPSIIPTLNNVLFSNITLGNALGITGLIEAVRMVHNGGHF